MLKKPPFGRGIEDLFHLVNDGHRFQRLFMLLRFAVSRPPEFQFPAHLPPRLVAQDDRGAALSRVIIDAFDDVDLVEIAEPIFGLGYSWHRRSGRSRS